MTTVAIVPRERAGEVWHLVAPHIGEALKRGGGDYDINDARGLVESGQWLLWIATQPGRLVAAAVTEVIPFPRRDVLWIVAAGGNMAEGAGPMVEQFRAHAVQRGIKTMKFLGRRGWLRSGALPGGWAHTHDIGTVEL